jgi:hypothetical protein
MGFLNTSHQILDHSGTIPNNAPAHPSIVKFGDCHHIQRPIFRNETLTRACGDGIQTWEAPTMEMEGTCQNGLKVDIYSFIENS